MSLKDKARAIGSVCGICGSNTNEYGIRAVNKVEGKQFNGKDVFVVECGNTARHTDAPIIQVVQEDNSPAGIIEIRAKDLTA